MRRFGLMLAGIGIGLVLTGYLLSRDGTEETAGSGPQETLNADIEGSTARIYRVKDGRLSECIEERTFGTREEAIDWVISETKVKASSIRYI